jgi:hypothetical protein
MKKHLLLLLCIVAVTISSCKKETLITEPTNRTILFDIFQNDWTTTDGGLTYVKRLSVPENTASFNHSGHIVVAMSFEDINEYEGLPQVYNGLSYQFVSGEGYVTIIISSPNRGTPISRPDFDATAKVTLIDAILLN